MRPGSGVAARLSSGTKEKGGRRDLQIRVSARPYHLLQGPKPDLVIGKSLEFTDGDLEKGWVLVWFGFGFLFLFTFWVRQLVIKA